jgi:aminoglycoside phosphotransferase (APT) family kinase protein
MLDGQPREVRLVLRLPRISRGDSRSRIARRLARLEREMRTLAAIEACGAEFDAPLFVCPVLGGHGQVLGMLQTFVSGRPLVGKNRDPSIAASSIDGLAASAAAVHRLPVEKFTHLRNLSQRGKWIERLLDSLPKELEAAFPEAAEARARVVEWASQPAASRQHACVVHGDLRAANVLSVASSKSKLAIVDWELARIGEPAVDLAAISRANRHIGGDEAGFQRLLSSYRQARGRPVTTADVHMHELVLLLAWLGVRWRHENEKQRRKRSGDRFAPKAKHLGGELSGLLRRLCGAESKP